MCFRSNISETVRDIQVPFSFLASAIVKLPDSTKVVSVVVVVSEIWNRQHQEFRMLTYMSEQNQYLFEWIHTANNNNNNKNKEISRSGLFFRSNITKTVRDIRLPFSLWPRSRVTLPKGANDFSVVLIVSEIYCRQYQEFRMLTYSTERVRIVARTVFRANNNNERDICQLANAEVVRKNHGNKIAGSSNDSSLAFKQIFSTFQQIWRNFERMSLNGPATVVEGHVA